MIGRVRSVLLFTTMLAAPVVFATPVDDLFRAVSIDDARTTRRLLQDRPSNRNAVDARGETLLIVAIRGGATHVGDDLIDDRATDLEATNGAGETAMMIAAYLKRPATVAKLITRGAEINRPGWTPLHYAASVDARDIVTLLLDHAAYIDAESPNRTTPLMMAARSAFGDLCRQLVEAGADPTPVNERDLAASDFARRAGDAKLAAWLDEQSVAWRIRYRTPVRPVPRN